jgi:Xaa-Pro dipeptidase
MSAWAERMRRLQEAARGQGYAAVAVMPGANLRYLTGLGYTPSKRLTLGFVSPSDDTFCFVLPAMEAERAQMESRVPIRLYAYEHYEDPLSALQRCMDELLISSGRIAAEHYAFRLMELRALEMCVPGVETEDATPLFTELRQVKDAEELAAMIEAVRMIETALTATIAQIKPGVTEKQLGALWLNELLATGAEGPSFPLTVASGPHGALPHHENGDRAFQEGDMIVLDGGAIHHGYVSDITRTVALGEPGEKAREVYELVRRANEAAREASRPGLSGKEIDAAAREVIEEGGYGPRFLHRTGHGLGLEIHEPPFIAVDNDQPLPSGATFTIEPGVYLSGEFGVRVEDMVALTEDGSQTLTTLNRELQILPV